jgi:hypothetical protein
MMMTTTTTTMMMMVMVMVVVVVVVVMMMMMMMMMIATVEVKPPCVHAVYLPRSETKTGANCVASSALLCVHLEPRRHFVNSLVHNLHTGIKVGKKKCNRNSVVLVTIFFHIYFCREQP